MTRQSINASIFNGGCSKDRRRDHRSTLNVEDSRGHSSDEFHDTLPGGSSHHPHSGASSTPGRLKRMPTSETVSVRMAITLESVYQTKPDTYCSALMWDHHLLNCGNSCSCEDKVRVAVLRLSSSPSPVTRRADEPHAALVLFNPPAACPMPAALKAFADLNTGGIMAFSNPRRGL